MLPGVVCGICLLIFILWSLWKHDHLQMEVDQIMFLDMTTSALFGAGLLISNKFYMTVDNSDPGILFCFLHRIGLYGTSTSHRMYGMMIALIRRKYVCDANSILLKEDRNSYINNLYRKCFGILLVLCILSSCVVFFPGSEKSLLSYAYCRNAPEAAKQNLDDFYEPHKKSDYEFLIHCMSAYSQLLFILISSSIEIVCIIQTYHGMNKYLKKNKAISGLSKKKRMRRNSVDFKGFVILSFLDLLIFCINVLGKSDGCIN